jgi:hypothetical protein
MTTQQTSIEQSAWWRRSTMSLGRVLARLSPPAPDGAVGRTSPDPDTGPRVLPRPTVSPASVAAVLGPALVADAKPELSRLASPRKPPRLELATRAPSTPPSALVAAPVPAPSAVFRGPADPGMVSELGRLNDELLRCETKYRELNERYMRNRAAALALGAVYLRIRNELSRIKKDPKQPRKLTDPTRVTLLEKTRTLIEEHELRALSGGRISPRDANPNW